MADERNDDVLNGETTAERPCDDAQQTPAPTGFFGSYVHGVDAKGRMIIPSPLRDGLGAVFAVGPTMDFKAIALYPVAEWQRTLAKLRALRELRPEVQRIIDQFAKCSYPSSETDAQGRLLLPQKLRSRMLGEAREVEISDALDHIRVVGAQAAAEADEKFEQDYPDVLAFLGSIH